MDIRKKEQISLFFWRRYSYTFDRINRAPLNKMFAKENSKVPRFQDRLAHFRFIEKEVIKDAPIDYLEFGVYQGESIKEFSRLNQHPSSRFFGFDSFEGLPEDWFEGFGKGAFNLEGKVPDIDDSRVSFVKGLFQQTLPNFLKGYVRNNRIVIHIDADLYTSTLFLLVNVHNILKSGDIIIFDDFLDPLGEFRAFFDYTKSFNVKPVPISIVNYGKLIDKIAFIL
jgi:O-methyltransferase